MAAKFGAAQWVIVIVKAVKVMFVHAAAREVAEVPLVAETEFIEVEVVVADAAVVVSIKPACYSVA